VSTDDERYTLMVLCWNPQSVSPVHDHPCEGCFVRVLSGAIQETRYEWPEGSCKAACDAAQTQGARATDILSVPANTSTWVRTEEADHKSPSTSLMRAKCSAEPADGVRGVCETDSASESQAALQCDGRPHPLPLRVVDRSVARAGDVTYIDDGMGLHAVEAMSVPGVSCEELRGAAAPPTV